VHLQDESTIETEVARSYRNSVMTYQIVRCHIRKIYTLRFAKLKIPHKEKYKTEKEMG
jgi:hypothetical protein